jgi:hypothetical protein
LNAAAPVAVTRPARPYPGLRPFERDEWSIFFGREKMIDEVIDRLAQNRLVLIHGASGSGKSSLVRAGVLPKLALQHLRHDASWRTCDMRPSGGPLWNLAAAFARLERRGTDIERIAAIAGQFNARSATLASVAASLEGVQGKSLCVLVDQFEELFSFEKENGRDEAELFVDLIERATTEGHGEAAPGVDLHVIVTMRSEFLGECARFAGFAETINRTQYLVPRMDDDGLMRAVRRPAQMFGGVFDAALAERLIASVRGREDELPLLQHGLASMWDDAIMRGHPGLDGSVVDAAGGLANLLSDHADKVMASVAPDERRQRIVEAVFRALTDVNAEGSAIRRPRTFNSLCAVAGAMAEELRCIFDAFRAPDVSFLRPYAPEPINEKTPIDISHEALIRCWRKIGPGANAWLLREFRDGLVWRTLQFQAENFAEDRSSYLSEAATETRAVWLTERNAAWSDRYGGGWPNVVRLVEASRWHWKQEREIAVKAQQRIAEIVEQKKAQRRIAQLASAGLALALLVAGFAVWQYAAVVRADREAQAQGTEARTQREAAVRERDLAAQASKDAVAQRDIALQAESAANKAKLAAQASADEAKANLRAAQIEQSRYLALLAGQQREAGYAVNAVLLALEALPDVAAGFVRPYVPVAEFQLDSAWRELREQMVLGHEGGVYSPAFSRDGKRIVTASDDKTARIWDAATGQPIAQLKGHEGAVYSAAFSPDGRRIVTASEDKTARIWDAATGQPIGQPLKGHEGAVYSAAFSPDGKRIVTASEDKTARIWDAATGQPIAQLKGQGAVTRAAFSPDGKRIVTASDDKTARIWDAATGQPIGQPLKGHEGAVTSSPAQ